MTVEVKDWKEVTFNDIFGVLTKEEYDSVARHVGMLPKSFERYDLFKKMAVLIELVTKYTGCKDVKELYYGRVVMKKVKAEEDKKRVEAILELLEESLGE